MKEVLAGFVASCELHRFENAAEIKSGLLLRPTKDWTAAIIVGASVRLCLPDGKEYAAKIEGFDLQSFIPKGAPVAILIEELPELDNRMRSGAKVFDSEKE
jgi:hypothetical protein